MARDRQDEGAPDTETTLSGEPAENEPASETETGEAASANTDTRCEAETQAGGNDYRCALEEGHDGEHAFTRIDAGDDQTEPVSEEAPEAEAAAEAARVEKEWKRVASYIDAQPAKIYGGPVEDMSECMLCRYWGTPGFVPHIECPDDLALVLSMYTGMHAAAELEQDYASEVCPKCKGHGSLRTGSTVPGQTELPCPYCSANGWVPVGDERSSATRYGTATNGGTAAYPAPAAQASVVPQSPADEDPEVARLRQMGYAVIPPMVVNG